MDEILNVGGLDDIAPHLPVYGYLIYAMIGIAYFMMQHGFLHILIP